MSGNGKKRKDIRRGQERQEALAREALDLQRPAIESGNSARSALEALLAGGPGNETFTNLGSDLFSQQSEANAQALAARGLNLSGASLEADAEARRRTGLETLGLFLNANNTLINGGNNANSVGSSVLNSAGSGALNAGFAQANTRRGFLGNVNDFGQAVKSVGDGVQSATKAGQQLGGLF